MDWQNLAYIIASIIFILGIKMLGRAESARQGNLLSAVGMLVAIAATLGGMAQAGEVAWGWIALGLAAGTVIGWVWAERVPMTGMPELVALFNGFGGLASLFVGWADVEAKAGEAMDPFNSTAVIATILIGGITFTGSVIAYLKLAGRMPGAAISFPAQRTLNGAVLAALLLSGFAWLSQGGDPVLLYVVVVLSLLLGILGVIPIGGGDMPVVIAFLNSFSGLAAAAAGFVILNNVLIVAGCLVGTSGVILTVIMCKAMNRSLVNVLFGTFGGGGGKSAQVTGEMKALSVEDAYHVLEAARSVIFVPGYGMAVAQAQHAVKELGKILESNGAEVRYAIHPVAGRMPGHMNVLLAEADVPYEQLCEMQDVNPTMEMVDVAIVVGANDVVNPAAADDPSSPIYGMPIINVHLAKSVFVLKRGGGAGFSGLVNTLFFRPNTRMVYGDAKATMLALAAQFKS